MKLFLLYFVTVVSLFAEDLEISWKDVPGNKGYQIQLLDKKSGNVETKISQVTSCLFTELKAGKYDIRVAALNIFQKPSRYSPWVTFKVKHNGGRQKLDLNQKNKAKFKISGLIPGLPQWKHNKGKSFIYWSLFAYYAYEGNRQRLNGNKITRDPGIQPLNLYLLSTTQNPLAIPWYLYHKKEARRKYDEYQSSQRDLAALAFATYLLHLVDWKTGSMRVSFGVYPERNDNRTALLFHLDF